MTPPPLSLTSHQVVEGIDHGLILSVPLRNALLRRDCTRLLARSLEEILVPVNLSLHLIPLQNRVLVAENPRRSRDHIFEIFAVPLESLGRNKVFGTSASACRSAPLAGALPSPTHLCPRRADPGVPQHARHGHARRRQLHGPVLGGLPRGGDHGPHVRLCEAREVPREGRRRGRRCHRSLAGSGAG